MGISNERRHYLTLPNEDYKQQLIDEAASVNMSVSKYIVHRLDLLYKVESNPVGKALVDNLNGNQQ